METGEQSEMRLPRVEWSDTLGLRKEWGQAIGGQEVIDGLCICCGILSPGTTLDLTLEVSI